MADTRVMQSTQGPAERFELVIFDCDGVVVDSERIVQEVFAEFLSELGLKLTPAEAYERFLGRRLVDCLAIARELTGRDVPQGALATYTARRDAVLREQVRPVEGVRAVLEALALPYCIASSGDHAKMRTTLGATGLWPLFEGRVFSATEVERGKPAPDVFLLAAARMGAQPARTVVIEDSVNGVLAGCAAGMTVLGFAGLTPAARLAAAGAKTTFERMCDLPALLA